MGYAEIPSMGKFLKARSRQGHSFHMNDSWVPIFRSLSYLVRSWEEVTCRYKYTNIYTSKYKKTSYDCVMGLDYYYLWTNGKPFWGVYLEKRIVTTQQTFSN